MRRVELSIQEVRRRYFADPENAAEVVGLHEFIKTEYPNLIFREKSRVICRLAAFVRELHDLGVAVRELIPENILLDGQGESATFFLRGKVHIKMLSGSLSDKERIAGLAVLFASLLSSTSRSERLRFLRYYLATDTGAPKWSEYIRAVEKEGIGAARRIWRKKTRLSVDNNQQFVTKCRGSWKLHRQRSAAAEKALETLFPDPDRCFEGARIFKPGSRTHGGMVRIGEACYFLKRYNCRSWVYRIRNSLRPSRAVKSWQVAWAFYNRGVPVPQPLLCIEERRFRLLGRSYVLMAFAKEDKTLRETWPTLNGGQKRDLLSALGNMLGRFHRFGCLHGDLKWDNILIGTERDFSFCLVDLDGSRVSLWPSRWMAQKDLRRFLLDLEKVDPEGIWKKVLLSAWSKWVANL